MNTEHEPAGCCAMGLCGPEAAQAAREANTQKVTATSWPRHTTKSVDTRKNDIVVRVADWTRDKDEPAYDVEVYIRGVYDWNESKSFTTKSSNRTKRVARDLAVKFAAEQLAKHVL